ncbi:unnamed protein product [Nezara viridula]|uniref:Uncharacterized protein n=1 Tax=Nezara viridula TaxID=85310 RepID=A0A9P0ECH9_NEZVI|nr:unnamed protein product [Nezara viridula]
MDRHIDGKEVLIEPFQLPGGTVRIARVLVTPSEGRVWVKAVNLCGKEVCIDKGIVIVVASPTHLVLGPSSRISSLGSSDNDNYFESFIEDRQNHLQIEDINSIKQLIERYVLSPERKGDFHCTGVEHAVVTGDAKPIAVRPYRTPHIMN